jgi:hypothetical protein
MTDVRADEQRKGAEKTGYSARWSRKKAGEAKEKTNEKFNEHYDSNCATWISVVGQMFL